MESSGSKLTEIRVPQNPLRDQELPSHVFNFRTHGCLYPFLNLRLTRMLCLTVFQSLRQTINLCNELSLISEESRLELSQVFDTPLGQFANHCCLVFNNQVFTV